MRKITLKYIIAFLIAALLFFVANNMNITHANLDCGANNIASNAASVTGSFNALPVLEANTKTDGELNGLPDETANVQEVATLQSLMLSNTDLDQIEFSPDIYQYQLHTNNLPYIFFKFQVNSIDSLITVNGININTNESTEIEKAILLNGGFNDITITVKEEGKLPGNYIISILNDDGKTYYRGTNSRLNDHMAIVLPGQTVQSLKSDICVINGNVCITDNNNEIKNDNDLCISGDKIVIKNHNDDIVYNSEIIIHGDANKDGYVNDKDIHLATSHILETYTLDSIERQSADVDCDGDVTIKDLGLIKASINETIEPFEQNIGIRLNAPESVYFGRQTSIKIDSTPGYYFAEGYLIYNEGKVDTRNIDNSGRIHFVIDGDNVLFDNHSSEVIISSCIESGYIDFNVEIVSTYDYLNKTEIELSTNNIRVYIKNSDIDVAIQMNESFADNEKDQKIATITLTNISSMSIGNINVSLGEYFTNNNKTDISLTGLRPGHSHKIKLYITNDMAQGHYDTYIKINYQDSKCVNRTISVPVSFEIENHKHTNVYQYDEYGHHISCAICEEKKTEEHTYIKESNGQYRCLVCDNKQSITLDLDVNEAYNLYQPIMLTPAVKINDRHVDISKNDVAWYVNGEKVSKESVLTMSFESIGIKAIDCVVKTDEGFVVVGSAEIHIDQQETADPNAISVVNVTCKTIAMKKYPGYEYKINDGDWKDFSAFLNLQEGQEYVVYQRMKNDPSTETSVKVMTRHYVKQYKVVENGCDEDVIRSGQCVFCRRVITEAISDTAHQHLFARYLKSMSATCQHGTIEIAECAYNCGAIDKRVLDDKCYHVFTEYTPDNNATCIGGATQTAFCDYGCNTYDTILTDIGLVGHQYDYVLDQEATTSSSATEIGICIRCGKENVRIVDGTRLKPITDIHITVPTATVQCYGLPPITTDTEGVTIVSAIWQDSQGVQFDGNEQNVVIKNNETYKLISLTISVDEKHALSEDIAFFVNGHEVSKITSVENNTITLADVGQFNFNQRNNDK
jgi:hypothetical protein